MADFLSVTERGTLQPVVTRYVGGFNRTVLSAPFGTTIGTDDIEEISSFNCVVQTDDDTLFAVLFDGLYRSVDSGATFTQVFAFPIPTTDVTRRLTHGGIHIAYDAGNQEVILGGVYFPTTGFTITGWTYRLSDGTTSVTDQAYNGSTDEIIGSEILYGTQIHLNLGNGLNQSNWMSFDIAAQSWADYTVPAVITTLGGASNCYAVGSDGALYLALFYVPGSIGTVGLFKFTGAWSHSGDFANTFNDSNYENNRDQARIALYSDGLDLICIALAGVTPSYGWQAYQVTAVSSFDPTLATERTSTMIPANLRNTVDGGTANGNPDKRCIVVQDTQSTPGTLETFLAFSDDAAPGTPWSVYQDQGVLSALTFVGTGGQVRDSLPQASRNGGAYFYTPGQPGVRITQVAPTAGGEIISFIASGGGTVDIQFRYGMSQQAATAIATLTGSATGGGTRVGNQVQGVTADGTTVNTITWDFFTDGFASGDALAVLVPETV